MLCLLGLIIFLKVSSFSELKHYIVKGLFLLSRFSVILFYLQEKVAVNVFHVICFAPCLYYGLNAFSIKFI